MTSKERSLWLSLGSNLGDRLIFLLEGLLDLEDKGLPLLAVSGIYETEPVGGVVQGPFLNMVVQTQSSLEAHEILTLCQAVEKQHHRKRRTHWGPRTLDIDLLYIEDEIHETSELQVPHPRMGERAFVLGPLFDLAPDWLAAEKLSENRGGIVLHIPAEDVKMLLQKKRQERHPL